MKEIITLASFNTQNPNMKKEAQEEACVQELLELMNKEKIDILCAQEMLTSSINLLKEKNPSLEVIGKSRYGNNFFSKNIQLLKKYNELTPIISTFQVLKSENYQLPWLPRKFKDLKLAIFKYRSVTPRILTEALIKTKRGNIVKILNTHLEKRILALKKRQLHVISKKMMKSTYPVILTGDFNMGLDQKLFQEFVNKLEENGLRRVEINQKTLKKSKKEFAIDHIFIPNHYQVLEKRIIDNKISDHYIILVKIEIDF